MRLNRSLIISPNSTQVFHVLSRVVDKRRIFNNIEKEFFLKSMRALETFSGLQILSYCLMGNHFHLLLHVPPRPDSISNDEVRNRMKHLYSKKKIAEFDQQIIEAKEAGYSQFETEFYDKMRSRMYDLSSYVRDLKLRFSKWYNTRHDRVGTLWESRFKSLLVEGNENAMMSTAAYIELNPVRAGIVDQPHDYRWSSFTEALAGGKRARSGIMMLAGGVTGALKDWDEASKTYRGYFIHKAGIQNHKRRGYSQEEMEAELAKGGVLSAKEIWETRVRYFTDGVVIGSQEYLESFLKERRGGIGEHRKRSGYRAGGSLWTYRKVK